LKGERGKKGKEKKVSSVIEILAPAGFLFMLCSVSLLYPLIKAKEAQQTIQSVFCLNVE
jgi:hypothetical protein